MAENTVIGGVTVEPGDKIWFAMPGRLGQGWVMLGPYEPDNIPSGETVDMLFRQKNGYNMLYYTAAGPDEETAAGHAHAQFRADCQRRRDEADKRFKAKMAADNT